MKSIQSAVDALPSHVALLDLDGNVIAVNKAWRAFSESNEGRGDYVGANYLEVCRRSAAVGSKGAARTFAGLARITAGTTNEFGQAYECNGAVYRLRAAAIETDDGRQVLVSHEDITTLIRARRAVRQARASEARLVEELGQRLAAIGLAVHVLKGHAATNQKAVTTIALALDEARHELKLIRQGQGGV